MIRPGEIYMADLPDAGRHPVIVVSREELNRGEVISAVLVTSAHFRARSKFANCVPFNAGEFGLIRECVAQCESIGPILVSQLDLADGPIGVLDEMALRDVVRAIGYVIESECEPV